MPNQSPSQAAKAAGLKSLAEAKKPGAPIGNKNAERPSSADANINIRLPRSLRDEAKRKAAEEGKTFTSWLLELIQQGVRK